mmetsp:Transcript_20627/g.26746  ORF Transcript_20627/g.26746 Transcript_20627/m.26746 type:complete len:397 (-) Transcript_20627:115-1305(-)
MMEKSRISYFTTFTVVIVVLLTIILQNHTFTTKLNTQRSLHLDIGQQLPLEQSPSEHRQGCDDPLWREMDCWNDVLIQDIPPLPVLRERCNAENRTDGEKKRVLYTTNTLGNWPKTHAHLLSLQSIEYAVDLVVVDDGSEDQTQEEVIKHGFKLVTNGNPPQGVTYAWNIAYAYFWAHCYDYIFITNNDVLVPYGAYSKIISALEDYHCAIAGPLSTKVGAGNNAKIQAITVVHPSMKHEEVVQFLENVANTGATSHQSAKVSEILNASNKVQSILSSKFRNYPWGRIHELSGNHSQSGRLNGFYFALTKDSFDARYDDHHLLDPKNRNLRNEYDIQNRLSQRNGKLCVVRDAFIYHFKGSTIPRKGVDREHWGKNIQLQHLKERQNHNIWNSSHQ